MLLILQVACVVLASIAMALSLAHALELPGRLKLDKEAYLIVQKIYYPGFTVGGFGEVLGIAAIVALLLLTPDESPAFGWTLASLVALIATHGVYWVLTHPVNKFWLKDHEMKGLGAGFSELVRTRKRRGPAMKRTFGSGIATAGSCHTSCAPRSLCRA